MFDGSFDISLSSSIHFVEPVAARAFDIASQRARESGAYTVLCRNSCHVGRLGSYTRKAALDGFAALMAVNGPSAAATVPWGGLDPRMGTNPISLAAPWGDEPIVLDMTTSATAEGKIRVASQKGEAIPEGWIIDKNGNPTTDPDDFYQGGRFFRWAVHSVSRDMVWESCSTYSAGFSLATVWPGKMFIQATTAFGFT